MADGTRQHFLRTARSGRQKCSVRQDRGTARKVGLHPNDLDKYPLELSGGKRQRAALAVDPNVSFFDEPFTAVDVGLKRALQDLVTAAAARKPSTHVSLQNVASKNDCITSCE